MAHTVTLNGTILVDRAALTASPAYQRQVAAFQRVVALGLGKAPEKKSEAASSQEKTSLTSVSDLS